MCVLPADELVITFSFETIASNCVLNLISRPYFPVVPSSTRIKCVWFLSRPGFPLSVNRYCTGGARFLPRF